MEMLKADFEKIGLRLTDPLRAILRRSIVNAYQAGVTSTREAVQEWMDEDEDGRRAKQLLAAARGIDHDSGDTDSGER